MSKENNFRKFNLTHVTWELLEHFEPPVDQPLPVFPHPAMHNPLTQAQAGFGVHFGLVREVLRTGSDWIHIKIFKLL